MYVLMRYCTFWGGGGECSEQQTFWQPYVSYLTVYFLIVFVENKVAFVCTAAARRVGRATDAR